MVDGFINSGNSPTTFRLSRLQNLDEEGKAPSELNAVVSVESDSGESFLLSEMEPGVYSYEVPVDNAKQYRLRIMTANDEEYLSDFVEVKNTPPIDSITWVVDEQYRELKIQVTTHDPQNQARYYQWDFEETWHFESAYKSKHIYKDGEIIFDPFLDIYNCWKTVRSTSILNATSSQLTEDVIYKFPLVSITPDSEKVRLLYSLLVQQYSLTADAYYYIEELKKYTQLSGSIFDPVPSRIQGNIRCISTPEKSAIGYINAHNIEELRVFIGDESLPVWFSEPYIPCPEGRGFNFDPNSIYIPGLLESGYILPITYEERGGHYVPGYALAVCVDCRKKKGIHKGGTTVKPDFWP